MDVVHVGSCIRFLIPITHSSSASAAGIERSVLEQPSELNSFGCCCAVQLNGARWQPRMSQFFDYELRRSPKAGGVLLTCWAQSHPVLAVASAGGRIEFFNEEGEESESRPIDRNAEPTALAWHHRGQLVAAGWDDGVVTLRRLDGDSRDSPSVHRVAVRFIQWSAQGNRFVTGDDEGVIGVWRAENRGHLSPISQYRKRDAPMTHCVFVSPSPADYARDTHGYASPEFLS